MPTWRMTQPPTPPSSPSYSPVPLTGRHCGTFPAMSWTRGRSETFSLFLVCPLWMWRNGSGAATCSG
ncbi:UDP-Gal or UDP-GlcNAc-dependent glycosyltransferase, putative, partial [Trypanosoma cruzi marinkellei]